MLVFFAALAHADPVVLSFTPLPPPRPLPAVPLLAGLAAGLGQAASPVVAPGPDQSPLTRAGWQCLGVDNATLDVARRCPFVDLTRRGVR